MGNEESNYKRESDKQWRDRTDERIASLTAGETVQNDRIDEIDEEIREIKTVIDGEPKDRADTGLKGDVEEIRVRLRRIDAILWPDAVGNSGLISDVRKLTKKEDREERRADRWWKGIVPIILATLSLTGLVLTNLDRIVPFLKTTLGRHIEISTTQKRHGGKTSKKRSHQTHVKEATTEATKDGTAEEEVPDGRSGDGGHAE